MKVNKNYLYDFNNHSEDYFNSIQNELSKKVDLHNNFNLNEINLVGGEQKQ